MRLQLGRNLRRSLLPAGLLLLAAQIPGAAAPSPAAAPRAYGPHVPGMVLLKFKEGTHPSDRANLRAQLQAQRKRRFRSGAESWKLGAGVTAEQAIARLEHNPHVAYAEPDYILQADVVPNDPSFSSLWGLENKGQTGGTAGADIGAVLAWDITTGSRAVVVGVVDSGMDYNHPDLAANVWTNPGEIAGNGLDDDNNGFVDDVHGWDFINDDNVPLDDNGHGTHVSGTIGAAGNNAIGVVGVNWQVSIMPLKFLGANGSGSTGDAVAALDYATQMGVRILNNSWGGGGFSQTLLDAINAAGAADVLFVASAGNSGSDNDLFPHYPSSYDALNVLSVANTDHNDKKSPSSNYGATTVDVAAPGTNILSTLPGGIYGSFSGTSMASPHVAGVAALTLANAAGLDALSLKQTILDTAERVPALAGLTVTGGRLFAPAAVRGPDSTPPSAITDLAASDPTSNTVTLRWTATGDDADTGTARLYDVRFATAPIDEAGFGTASRAAGAPAPSPAGSPEQMEVAGLAAGTVHFFAVKAIDDWGNAGDLSNVASQTTLPPPTIDSSPAAFTVSLLTGQQAMLSLNLRNSGVGTLDWTIPPPVLIAGGSLAGLLVPGTPGLEPAGSILQPAGAVQTGSGYLVTDADLPGGPVFDWTDIAEAGTPISSLTGDNEVSEPLELGFDFPLYGTFFDAVRVSTDGWLSFTSGGAAPDPLALPDAAAPPNLVAPFWADLDFRGAARASFYRAWDRFTVQYTDVPGRSGTGSYTFQATLGEDGSITFAYLSMTGEIAGATAGIQDGDGSRAIAIDAAAIHDAQAVQISALSPWLVASPTQGRLFAGQDEDVTLSVDARALPGGSYTGVVNVETNDPARPVAAHAVSLNVTDSAAIEVDAAGIDFGDVHVGFTSIVPVLVTNTGTLDLDVTISSPEPAVAAGPASVVVAPGSARNVDVSFTPTAPGAISSSLEIASNASNSPAITIPVTGNALAAPGVGVSPLSLSEHLLTSRTSTQTLRVTNTGGGTLSLQASTELTAPGPLLSPPAAGPAGGPSIEAIPVPEIVNGGFELGNFTGWSATANGFTQLTPWTIGGAGGGYFGTSSPFEGNVDLYNGFDGDAGLEYTLTQQIEIPKGTATAELSFHDRIQYDGMGTPSSLPRVYHATIRDTSLNILATIVREEIFLDGRSYTDTGWRRRAIDLAPYAGRTVVLHIWERIPESFTGPAVIEFDDFEITATAIPDWLMVTPSSAAIPPGGSQDLTVTFDAGGSGSAVYHGAVRLDTNDPAAPTLKVPAVLEVTGVPDILVHGPEVTVSSTRSFTGQGAFTTHALSLPSPPARDGAIDFIGEGDFGADFETATLIAEGNTLGSVGGSGADCAPALDTFPLTRSMLASLAADGVVDLRVENSADVQDFCTENRHTVKLRYRSGLGAVAFGSVFVGGRATDTFEVSNDGADPLVVTSIDGAAPDFEASPAAFNLQPGDRQIVTLRFEPSRAGAFAETLSIRSNDPDTPVASLPVSGNGLEPPVVSVAPGSLSSTLPSGGIETQTLTLSNLGTHDLSFSINGTALPSANAACSAAKAYLTSFNNGLLWEVDLANQAAGAVASGLQSPNEGLVVDGAGTTAYVTEAIVGTVSAIDLVNGGISRIVTGLGFPVGLALDATDARLYVTEFSSGKLLSVDLSTFAVQTVAAGMASPAGLVLDPTGAKAYICDFVEGTIEVADLAAGSIARLASGLAQPYSVALDRPRGRLLVSEFGSAELSAVDLATGAVSLVAGSLTHPIGVGVDLDSTTAYVNLFDSGALVAVDLATGSVNAVLSGFSGPSGLHVPAPPGCISQFLSLSVHSGTLAPFASVPISVTFDATGLLAGGYPAEIGVASNDPVHPFVAVPVQLDVTGTPDIAIAGTKIDVESTIDYGTDGAVTNHALPVTLPPVGGATVELIALGDHGLPSETATATGEGIFTLTAGGAVADCVPAVARLGLTAADVASLVADGVVHVTVQNSPEVNPFCAVNQHTVRFGFELRADILDFQTVFTGTSKDIFFDVENRGTDVLVVTSISSSHPEVTVQPASFTVPPRGSRTVTVTFAPLGTGALSSTVEIDSDDPDSPRLSLPVAGIGADPPIISVTPGSLSSTLLSGDGETQSLTISNGGPSDLDVELSASLFGSNASTSPFAGLGSELQGYSDNPPPALPSGPGPAALADPGGPEEPAGFADGLPGEFEPLASSPEPLTCVAEDQAAGLIYAQSNRTSTFYRYVAAEDRWETLAHAPLVASNNCGAALLNGRIYTAYTLDTTLGVYDIATDTWSTMPSPLPNGTGNIGSDGARWLYLVEGTSFTRVDPATGQKEPLAPPPIPFERWGGLREINGVFYGHQGNSLTGFAAYDVASGAWRALASLPTGAVLGAAASAQEGEYYAYGNYGARNILTYSTTTATWSARTNPYFPVNDGGLAWLPRPVPGVYIIEGQSGPRMARMITGRDFIGLDPVKATVGPGASADVAVSFESAGLLAGDHPAEILISSNDPIRPLLSVPATLNVIGSPKLFLTGGEVALESVMDFTASGEETIHDFALPAPPAAGGRIELEANGDYAGSGETAEVRAEGLLLGSVGASGTDCAPTFGSFPLDAAEMSALSADDTVEVSVRNSFGVDPFCAVNQHTVRLIYDRPAEAIDYGTIFVGASATETIFAANTGTDPLHVQLTLSPPGASFAASPSSLTVTPGGKRAIVVSFSPSAAGPHAATLVVESDDPRNARTEIDLTGAGRLAPVVSADPTTLFATAVQGFPTTEIFTIFNTGGSDLNFTLVASAKGFPLFLSASPASGAVPAGASLPITVTFDPGSLGPGFYLGLISLESDDPVTPVLDVQARFRVRGIPDIQVIAQEKAELSSSASFSTSPATTSHHLGPAPAPAGDVTFEITAEGNFAGPLHTASVRAEGVLIGTVASAAGTGCATAKQTLVRSQAVLAPLFADSFLDVTVQNSPIVAPNCPVNRHLVKITYPSDRPGLLKFGALFVGAAVSRAFEIRNLGNETLAVASMTADLPDYTASPASLNVAPGGKQSITITFVPKADGARDAVLTIASDDPDTPAATIDLQGTGLPPPVARLSPAGFEVAVPPGGSASRVLEVANAGFADLSWSLEGPPASVPSWLSLAPLSGTLGPGQASLVQLGFDASGLPDGDHSATLAFLTNDPVRPRVEIDLLLHSGEVDLAWTDLDPDTLSARSSGQTIRALLQLPAGHDPAGIVVSSILLNGLVAANPSPVGITDENRDGIGELMIKFDRAAVQALLAEGQEVPVTITGEVRDKTWFTGTTVIRVIRPALSHPSGGEFLLIGRPLAVSWRAPEWSSPVTYGIELSRDAGASWERIASGVSGTSYSWSVSGPPASGALLRVTASDPQGALGSDTTDRLFVISDALRPPAGIAALRAGADGADLILTWERPAADVTHGPAAEYRVLRASAPGGPFSEIARTGSESHREPLSGGSAPVEYYAVVPANAAGEAPD